MKDGTKTVIKIVVSIVLIAVSGYLSIVNIAFDELIGALKSANYLWVLLSIPVILLAHVLRALRWKTMLQPIMKADSVYNLFKAVMIGYAANNVTPRGGELLRPFVYARQEKVSFTSVFGTIVVERFLDLLTLLLLFAFSLVVFSGKINTALAVVFSQLGSNSEGGVDINLTSLIYIVALFVVVLVFAFYPPVAEFILKVCLKPFSKKLYERFVNLFEKFRIGFQVIKEPSTYLRLAMDSILIWVCYGLPMFIMFFCFDFQDRLMLGIGDAFLLLIVSGVAVTIAPTPGAIGVQHAAIRWGMLALYAGQGLQSNEAVAYAILTHGVNFIVNSLVGGYYYVREKKSIPNKTAMKEEIETM